jgi:hypothetical protein
MTYVTYIMINVRQADAAAVTISELREQLTAALADAAQKGAETDDVVEGIRKDLTARALSTELHGN